MVVVVIVVVIARVDAGRGMAKVDRVVVPVGDVMLVAVVRGSKWS